MLIFWSAENVWRKVAPGDERLACRAFAGWSETRRAIGPWVAGTMISYTDCIDGVSAQMVADATADYRALPGPEESRVLVTANTLAIVGRDTVYIARDEPGDVHTLAEEVLTWFSHVAGAVGDVLLGVKNGDAVDEALVAIHHRDPNVVVLSYPD